MATVFRKVISGRLCRFQNDATYLDTFDIDPWADEFLPDQRGFGISTGDWVEDIGFYIHLLS